jgi:indolepyruvate ferredoxin oxidoreductase
MILVFYFLKKLRWLRGSPLDVFGYTAERRMERRLIHEFECVIQRICSKLNLENFPVAMEIAELPNMVRGFGHIKEAAVARYEARLFDLLRQLDGEGLIAKVA